jgi:ATP adenylyltransferase
MEVLWSPWRYDYIKEHSPAEMSGCVFCDIISNGRSDEENFIVFRGEHNFVVLNIYPYTSGHTMIVPYEHLGMPSDAPDEAAVEMVRLLQRCQAAIWQAYSPDGINLGMNLGKAAGAGVRDHYHMHILPRWIGDVNFMTAIGQTRTLPESLIDSYDKLRRHF